MTLLLRMNRLLALTYKSISNLKKAFISKYCTKSDLKIYIKKINFLCCAQKSPSLQMSPLPEKYNIVYILFILSWLKWLMQIILRKNIKRKYGDHKCFFIHLFTFQFLKYFQIFVYFYISQIWMWVFDLPPALISIGVKIER